jgi:hypothetical protein
VPSGLVHVSRLPLAVGEVDPPGVRSPPIGASAFVRQPDARVAERLRASTALPRAPRPMR